MSLIFVGLVFCIFAGLFFKIVPPKKINHIYGWRSRMSMKNIDTWNEAQRFGSNIFIIGGIFLAIFGAIIYICYGEVTKKIECIIIVITTAIILISGEVHLREVFNKDGSRKTVL